MSIPGIEDVGVALLVLPESLRVLRASLHIRIATAPRTTTSRPIRIAAVPARAPPHPRSRFVPVPPLLLTMPPSLPARQPGLVDAARLHRRVSGRGWTRGEVRDDSGFSTFLKATCRLGRGLWQCSSAADSTREPMRVTAPPQIIACV